MTQNLANQWRDTFFQTVRQHQNAAPLQDASRHGHLGKWTSNLTNVVIGACQAMGWSASARGHKLKLLPVSRHEYLSQDVMAFIGGPPRWSFPVAVMELENRQSLDYIAYALWKVLCVRADLRVLYCYRRSAADVSGLVRFLQNDVIGSMGISRRMALSGQTLLVIGSRDEADTFPYGPFQVVAVGGKHRSIPADLSDEAECIYARTKSMSILFSDTTPEAEAVLIDLLRQAPPWRKLEMMRQLNQTVRTVALSGLRHRHPNAGEAELRRRLAGMLLGPALALQVYGPVPESETRHDD